MDDFGVLVQTYGIKPQGKSAPMAASKSSSSRPHNSSWVNPDQKPTHHSSSFNGSLLDDQNDAFGFGFSNSKPRSYSAGSFVDSDFGNNGGGGSGGGLGFDMEEMFMGSMNLNTKKASNVVVDDGLMWGVSGNVSSKGVVGGGDLLSMDPVDDFLGSLGKMGSKLEGNKASNVVDSDELIPGFGSGSSTSTNRTQAYSTEKSSGLSSVEELENFVSGKTKTVEKAPPSSNGKNSRSSSIEELEEFGLGKMKKNANGSLGSLKLKNDPKKASKPKPVETNFVNLDKNVPKKASKPKPVQTNFIDLDIEGSFSGNTVHQENLDRGNQDLFGAGVPGLDSIFGEYSQKVKPLSEEITRKGKTEEKPDLSSGTAFNTKKKISPGSSYDDFSFLFGVAQTSTQFEEIEGESKERRQARVVHYQTTQARMAQALADLNEREFRAQQEQEERHRIAEGMEMEMKRWAAGKEGNLRALLSSLQQVLAPELGWKPVTLTGLITPSQVKMAYKKAALCVHPDKVQQKGAKLEQKFVAEKVFDLLKEAWNKFNAEELR